MTYADPEDHCYIAISGKGQIIRDPGKAAQLWSPIYEAWFPAGLADPDLSLIRISVEKAEYWDVPSSQAVHLLDLAG